jgi:DNA ligase-1
MLHLATALHQSGRSDALLKLKPYFDEEAEVIAHLPGKGKYTDMLGALRVRNQQGIEFSVGTGFTDAERANPPPVGSIITYKYHGYTSNGVPRFASFLRIREVVEGE